MKALRSRGQAMVVFALTLLLLTFMVLLTISFGMRVRERMELQTLADAAAYSNAVASARTFNVIAVMNRTEWSLLVAQSATQAYISWTSAYWGAINQLKGPGYAQVQLQLSNIAICPLPAQPAARAKAAEWKAKLDAEDATIRGKWDGPDIAASSSVRGLNSAEAAMHGADFKGNYDKLEAHIKNQALAGKVVALAQPLSPWTLEAPASAASRNMKEIAPDCKNGVACDPMPGSAGAGNSGDNSIMHQYEIYMGSRGDGFTTGRSGGAVMITNKLRQVLQGTQGVPLYTGRGASSRGDQFQGPVHGQQANPGAAHSDDDGSVSWAGVFGSCPVALIPINVRTHVRANLMANPDVHRWSGGTCPNQSDVSHSLIGDIAGGNWPIVIDYNTDQASNPQNVHGQPKLFAVIQRDYTSRNDGKPEPYQLNVPIKFASKTNRFDNRGINVAGQPMNKSTAVATGLAYYHRGGDWAEPPNFMNPFWRATLVVPDIDDASLEHVIEAVEEADSRAAEGLRALKDQNFKGWQ